MAEVIQIAATAEEAYARYQAALSQDALIQAGWHGVAADGRQLACALGMLGSEVSSPRDCPAQIMPRWLAQMVPSFFDQMEFEAAKAWGLDFYANADANADAYADANADAYAYAYANAKQTRRQEAYARLANGMVECLRRVPSPDAAQ